MSEFRFPLDADNRCQGCGLNIPTDQELLSHECEALRYVQLLKSNRQLNEQLAALRQALGSDESSEVERETMQNEAFGFTFGLECNLECQGCGESLGDPISYEEHRCPSRVFVRSIRRNTKLKRRKLAFEAQLAYRQWQAGQKSKKKRD